MANDKEPEKMPESHPATPRPIVPVVLALMWPLAAPGERAGTAAEACGGLVENLRRCQPYACEFERPVSGDSQETVMTAYSISGKDADGCGYEVTIGERRILRCRLSDESRETVARVAELQLDGTWARYRQSLLERMAGTSGQVDTEAMLAVDSEFTELNRDFLAVLRGECDS